MNSRLHSHCLRKILPLATLGLFLAGCSTAIHSDVTKVDTEALKPQAEVTAEVAKKTGHAYGQDANFDADTGSSDDFGIEVNDKNEKLNRTFLGINRRLDVAIFRPISKVYRAVIPGPIRLAVRNGYRHLDAPGNLINYTLQGEGRQAGIVVKRFLINSTLGLGGTLDVADHMGIPHNPTDFGVTLGKRGYKGGRYLVNPLFGPSNVRDSIGRVLDTAFSPLTYLGFIVDVPFIGLGVNRGRVIDQRLQNGDLIDNVIFASPDPYVTLRSTYLQRRRALISGETAENIGDALPDIETSE